MRRIVVLGNDGEDAGAGRHLADAALPARAARGSGFEPLYVEAHARTPSMLMQRAERRRRRARRRASSMACCTPSASATAGPIHALHDDGRCLGMSERAAAPLLPRRRADHQPARRHRAAPGARRRRPPRLPGDRPGGARRSSCTTVSQSTRRVPGGRTSPSSRFAENLGTPHLRAAGRSRASGFSPRASRWCWTCGGTSAGGTSRASRRSATGASTGATSATRASATAGARTSSGSSSSTCPAAPAPRFELALSGYEPADRGAAGGARLGRARRARPRPGRLPRLHRRLGAASSPSPRIRTCASPAAGSATAAPPTWPPAGR